MVPGRGSVATGVGLDVSVAVGVAVAVDVTVDVLVPVDVVVGVASEITVGVAVGMVTCVRIDVSVDAGRRVAVWVGAIYTNVFVGLCAITAVLVTEERIVGVGDAKLVRVIRGNGVPVTKDAPGVRNTLIQLGCVRMDASTGSMNPSGLWVRKLLFGSRWESISVFNCQ